MKITKKVVQEQSQITAIQCDCCKKSYDVLDDSFEVQEFTHIDYIAGYGSIFEDGKSVKADICQHCLKDKFGAILTIGGSAQE